MIQTDPLNQLLNGRPISYVPVAPVYEGLGPLEFYRMELRWRKWWGLLDEAGSDLLPVDYHTYLNLELAIHTDILDSLYPPPAWLGMPYNMTPSEAAGCAVVRRNRDLFWLNPDGNASWIPPNEAAYQESLIAQREIPFGISEANPNAASVVQQATSRPLHDLSSHPEPATEQADALIESGRYDLAKALLDRYPGNLPLYSFGSSPYEQLWGALGFQGSMYALTETPELCHKILENALPRTSARLEAERKLGVGILFFQSCLASADLISPKMYLEFSHRYNKQALQFYEDRGFRTVLYFSGNLMPLLDYLKALPFTALSFEEDRKNYGIDLAEVRRVLGPDRVLFGNVDAPFVERATDHELLDEVRRQIAVAGRDSNFVLSIGSPFTPRTSLERVRFFCESTKVL